LSFRDFLRDYPLGLALLTMRVAILLEPEHVDTLPTREFLNRLAASNPQYTAWPMVYCVAEAIAVSVSIARAAGWSADDRAEIAFRWTALEGRKIQGWAIPVRSIGLG